MIGGEMINPTAVTDAIHQKTMDQLDIHGSIDPVTMSPLDNNSGTIEYSGLNDSVLGLPSDLTFNEDGLISVIAYTVMFVISTLGNMSVFITLFRNGRRRSRVNKFILHLAMADLVVTFINMPLEVAWHLTVSWRAGDLACRLLMFFRAFGLYLSSFILITISLDRYFAVRHPPSLNEADHRGRLMLMLAWCLSVIASIPQSIIFHVESHPDHPWFSQCVTFNFFPSPSHELAYNLFNITAIYCLPLVVISVSYCFILYEITRRAKQNKQRLMSASMTTWRQVDIRRMALVRIEKARTRTLKMTVVIVLVFIVCWTPYFVMSAWWWFDEKSARSINPKIQNGLFLFAVSNSCVNPIVYGMFTTVFRRSMKKSCFRLASICLPKIKRRRNLEHYM